MTVADLLSLIARLCAALLAPAHMIARVAGRDARWLAGFAHLLERMKARGMALAYEGDDDATIAARMDRAAWIATDPVAALKHMVRGCRGGDLVRLRMGMVAPPDEAPPVIVCAPLRASVEAAAHADTS